MAKIIKTERVTKKMAIWEKLASNLVGYEGFYVALMELVRNAVEGARAKNRVGARINIILTKTHLIIEDNGGMTPDVFKALLDYGFSLHISKNNENGVGEKVGLSFMYPINGGLFKIVTRSEYGIYCIKSPYDFVKDTDVHQLDEWDYDNAFNTHLETQIYDENIVPPLEDVEKRLSIMLKRYMEKGLIVEFNGKELKPFKHHGSTESMKHKSIVLSEGTVDVYWEHTWRDDAPEDPCTSTTHGATIYEEDCFVQYVGTDVVAMMKGDGYYDDHSIHGDVNELVTDVYLESHGCRLPRNSTKNEIDWDSPLGKEYRKAISDCIKDEYHKLKREVAAATARKREKAVEEFTVMAYQVFNAENGQHYSTTQVRVASDVGRITDIACFTATTQEMRDELEAARNDAVLVLNKDLVNKMKLVKISETKHYRKIIREEEVGEVIGFLRGFKRKYGYVPDAEIIGKGIGRDAEEMIEDYKKIFGCEITFRKAIDVDQMWNKFFAYFKTMEDVA